MKYIWRNLITIIALVMALPVLGAGEDLENCKWKNGLAIDPQVCNALRRYAEEDRIKKEMEDATLAAIREAEKKRAEEQRLQNEESRRRREIESAKQEADRKARLEAVQREQEAIDRAADRAQRKAVADREKQKQVCGIDFGTPRIGMTLGRAQQCVGKFKLTSEINRADGIVSTYQTRSMYIHVMSGQIVSWGRF